jgi:RHS repeat-associated protein
VLLGESAAHALDAPSPDPLAVVYLHEPGSFRPLAQLRRNGGADQRSQVYHYHLDHLGTPQELTNDNGELVWQAEYRAWGALAKLHVAEVENPLRFQGQYHDAETGLHYNRHRYYAPNEGCFTTQDPIRLAGGSNLAAYAPNPVEWVDPLGLSCGVDGKGVNPYEVDTYKNLRNRSLAGDKLDIDHQPSHASNIARTEAELGRRLTPAEIIQVRDEGTAVAVPQDWHRQQSPTFGGRNTPSQIQADALNPQGAAYRDSQAMIDGASFENKAAAEAAAAQIREISGGL